MFKTINGYEHGVFYISSIKKDVANNTLIFYLMNGGSIKAEFDSSEEMEEKYQEFVDVGIYVPINDRVYNTIHFSTVDKGEIAGVYSVLITIRTGETLHGDFDTEAARDEFYELIMESGFGGLIQRDTFDDFPKTGSTVCVYIAKDTGITYYWDRNLKQYVTVGSGGRKGVYEAPKGLNPTIGAKETIKKTDLKEIVKATVDFMETSDVIDKDGVRAIIVKNNKDTVDVVTVPDQTIDSFKQVETLSDLPAVGKTNILFYVKDIDEFRVWDDEVNDWVEPFHPIIFGDPDVADARINTLYINDSIAKYTTDNVEWVYLSPIRFEDVDVADAILETIYIDGSTAKYTLDNTEWIYLSSVLFDDPAVEDAVPSILYVNGTEIKYTTDNVEWIYLSSVFFDDPAVEDAIPEKIYVNDKEVKYTLDNVEWVYLNSVIFEDPDIEDAIPEKLYINDNEIKYTLDNVDWVYIKSGASLYEQGVEYPKGSLVYLNNILVKVLDTYTSDDTEVDENASFTKDIDDGYLEVIVDAYTRTNVQYDLSDQLDGITQEFDIPTSVTNDRSILVFYAGQLLVEGVTYTIDFANNKLKTHFDYAPDTDEDRHLILIAGNIETTPPMVRTVTGEEEGMVDNTDPLNPVVLHDPTKVDSVTDEDGDLVDNTDPLNPVILHDPTKVESVNDENGDLVDNTDPLNPIILHDPTKVESVTGEDSDMVDDSDPLNPVILHDSTKIDKDVAIDSDGYIEGKTEVSQDGDTVVIDKVNLVVDDNTSENKHYVIKSSDGSIVFDLVEVDNENTEIDVIVENANSTNIAYDLTDQMNGVTQVFNIDPTINEKKSIIVFYAGQYLVRGVNYTVDFTNHTITTLLDEAPDSGESKHLTLIVGNTTITDAVQTISGDMVDNTDPANPVIKHDDDKVDKTTIPDVLTKTTVDEVTDGIEVTRTTTNTSDGTTTDEKVIIKPDETVKISINTLNPSIKEVKISVKGNTTVTENAIIFDGVNSEFTLPNHIDTSSPIVVTVNGLVLTSGPDADYKIIGNKIKFAYVFDTDSNVIIANFK